MPLYEYRCQECDHRFEFLQLGKDEEVLCPQCQSKQLSQLLSVVAGHASSQSSQKKNECPPISSGPCGPGCCRIR